MLSLGEPDELGAAPVLGVARGGLLLLHEDRLVVFVYRNKLPLDVVIVWLVSVR